MTTETQFARDIFSLFNALIQGTHHEANDGIVAALTRIREAAITDEERAAQRVAHLVSRRSFLVPKRNGLADKKGQLADVVWHMNAVAAEQNKDPKDRKYPGERVTPMELARAKTNLDRASAEYEKCVAELAAIEAEINSMKNAAKAA
jgi:hypothetical protein